MEETNNTSTPDQPVIQTTNSPLIQPTPKINIYKYLLFISILVLLAVVIYFYFILNSKNSQPSLVNEESNFSETTSTNTSVQTVTSIPKESTSDSTKTGNNQNYNEYNGKGFFLTYPNNWIITTISSNEVTHKPQEIFFHPNETVIGDNIKPSQFFEVWGPAHPSYDGLICFPTINDLTDPKSEVVIFNGHKGTKCSHSNKTTFAFSLPINSKTESPLGIKFVFTGEVNNTLVDQVISSFKQK